MGDRADELRIWWGGGRSFDEVDVMVGREAMGELVSKTLGSSFDFAGIEIDE